MVLELNQGELILVVRRPSSRDTWTETSDYVPCPDCLGFYCKTELRKHITHNCIARGDGERSDGERSFRDLKLESSLLMNEFTRASPLVKTVLARMKQDLVTKTVQNDPMIIQLGNAHARKTTGMDPQRRRH